MKFKLKIDGKVKYSNGEIAVFKALSAKALSSTDIMDKIYYTKNDVPHNGRKILIGQITSLRRKIQTNREPFKLSSTKRRGPHPMEFWLEGK